MSLLNRHLQGSLRKNGTRPRRIDPWSWPQPRDMCVVAAIATTDLALAGVSFDIYPGEFVFLVGQSGSGKSTTMKLLIKEADLTAGEIRVAGRDLAKIPRARV